MLTRFLRFLIFILNWSIVAGIVWLNFILLSNNPTLTLLDYTFNPRQLCFLNALLMGLFTYKERHCIKQEIIRFVRWFKSL